MPESNAMLEHEPQENSVPTSAAPLPAAQIRVTPEELAAALRALEAEKEQTALHLAGTVPIGEVVSEMNLEATPEEIWAQVQRQRAQPKAVEQAQARTPAPITRKAVTRRVLRGWRDIKGWVWVLFWCSGGLGLVTTGLQHLMHLQTHSGANSGSAMHRTMSLTTQSGTVLVSGNEGKLAYTLHHERIVVEGDSGEISLQGDCTNLCVEGDGNLIRITGTVKDGTVDGDHNVIWIKGTSGHIDMDPRHGNQIQMAGL